MREKGQVVEIWRDHNTGITIQIRFDKRTGNFTAKHGDENFSEKTIHVIREHLHKLAKTLNQKLDWKPVIKIFFHERFANDTQKVNLGFEREWFTQQVDGKWKRAEWDNSGLDRAHLMRSFSISVWEKEGRRDIPFSIPFKDIYSEGEERPTFYIPYTEDMWAMLERLNKMLEAIQQRIIEHLGDEKKRKLLVENFSRLLPESTRRK